MLFRNRFCLLDEKIRDKSPDHIFDLNVYGMLHTIIFQSSVLSFFDLSYRSASNFFLSAVLFFSASVPVYLFAVLQTLSLIFLQKLLGRQEKQ